MDLVRRLLGVAAVQLDLQTQEGFEQNKGGGERQASGGVLLIRKLHRRERLSALPPRMPHLNQLLLLLLLLLMPLNRAGVLPRATQ